MIYITGDMHGELAKLLLFVNTYNPKPEDTLMVCGDFGFIFNDDDIEKEKLDYLETLGFTICFVDGNHEAFPVIFSYPEEEWNGGLIHRIRKNVIHLMRGQVFLIEGKKYFTMGGAYSVDRAFRETWWNEEIPNDEEFKQALKNLADNDMKVDYVLTHTAPRPMIYPLKKAPDLHEASLSNFLDYLYYDLEYKHWYAGHFHEDRDINQKFTFLWHNVIKLRN